MMRSLAFAGCIALAVTLSIGDAQAQSCPTRPAWPTETWPDRTQELATSKAAEIEALETYAFTRVGEETERLGVRTDGVVIIHQGAIVYEKYVPAYGPEKRHIAWSVTKSVTNALTGLAVQRGAVSLDDSICDHLEIDKPESCAVKVGNLLEFSSGFDWTELYEDKSNQASSVLAMLYGEGRYDMARFVARHRLRDAPGTSFMYSTGETLLLASTVQEAVQKSLQKGDVFPWEWLFTPIGMQSAVLERDAKGHFKGGSHLFATPRDFARFGWLYLNDGCWEGERLLPEGWVADSTRVSDVFRTSTVAIDESASQGRQWWLNQAVPEQGMPNLPWPDVPGDAFVALGHWGQSIAVIPSLDVVVVRVADDRDGTFDLNRFLDLALEVVR